MPASPVAFDPGYVSEPFMTLVAGYPGDDVYPPGDFRTEWGPVFHRGRLDGTARILVLGQDPAQHEVVVRRVLVGTAGKRVQGCLARLGYPRSYVIINAYLYSVYGQGGGNRHIDNAAIAAYRNRWIAAILDTQPIEAVVAFGGLAKAAWSAWLAAPQAEGRTTLPFAALTHPTWPESSTRTKVERVAATKTLLKNWNTGLNRLEGLDHQDTPGAFRRYGSAFEDTDLPDIPTMDVPAGTPLWMCTENAWAHREGDTPLMKRRTIVVRVPKALVR
jgi:uracil-DNA glycosylase